MRYSQMMALPRPATILDLRDSPWVDGPGRTILDCAETIDANSFRIIVGTFDGGNSGGTAYEFEARRLGLEAVRIRERRSLDLNVLRQVIEIGRQYDARLIHSHDFRSDFVGFLAAKSLRIPHIATVHGWIANSLSGRLRSRLDKMILRRADHVISVSEETKRRLGAWATNKRCSVIPNALRGENFQPNRGVGEFRAANGINEGEVVIANVGRLSPEKGQMQFLTAARELSHRHKALRFVLFGHGPDRSDLEQFVVKSGLESSVIFAGYRSDMHRVYNEIDLIVQSSFTEGMPNVVLEAAFMEVPVVATDVGGTREIVMNGETGTLIPAGSYEAIVSAIESFLMERAIFDSMARKARIDVASRFSHSQRVEQLSMVYQRVLLEKRGHR